MLHAKNCCIGPAKACWPFHSGICAYFVQKSISRFAISQHFLITFSAAAVHRDMLDYPGFL
jgi:hypothetical protein